VELLEDWQHKVGYIQNRSLGDRIATYSNTFVQGDYCDLYSRREVCSTYLYCDLETQALVSPLHCSVIEKAAMLRAEGSYDPTLKNVGFKQGRPISRALRVTLVPTLVPR
jgi:hypothetical protein